jgi:hypothetical protein
VKIGSPKLWIHKQFKTQEMEQLGLFQEGKPLALSTAQGFYHSHIIPNHAPSLSPSVGTRTRRGIGQGEPMALRRAGVTNGGP